MLPPDRLHAARAVGVSTDMVKGWLIPVFLLLSVTVCRGQFGMLDEEVKRAAALRDRFVRFRNPVSASYSIAGLGSLVCQYDKSAGTTLLTEAVQSLATLPGRAFSDTADILPVTSFTALTRFVLHAARKCDPALTPGLGGERLQERMNRERNEANQRIGLARSGISEKRADRAAQLLNSVLGASEPNRFDFHNFIKALSELRELAPELADDLFAEAVQYGVDYDADASYLAELAKYLFTDRNLLESEDRDQEETYFSAGGQDIPRLQEERRSTNPESVYLFMDGAMKLLGRVELRDLNPALSYALTEVLLPRAREQGFGQLDQLTTIDAALSTEPAAYAAEIRAGLGVDAEQGVPLEEVNDTLRNDRLVGRFRKEWSTGHFDVARSVMTRVADQAIRTQLAGLLQFGEAAEAIRTKRFDSARERIGLIPSRAKRSLLSIGLAATASEPVIVEEAISAAWTDTDALPAEARAALLAPLAAATLASDTDRAFALIKRLVASINEAAVTPRKSRFDPGKIRKNFTFDGDKTLEPTVMIRLGHPAFEMVDVIRGRHTFPLKVAGLEMIDLPALLQRAESADPDRLESIVMDLRDESRVGPALVGLAARRISLSAKALDSKKK